MEKKGQSFVRIKRRDRDGREAEPPEPPVKTYPPLGQSQPRRERGEAHTRIVVPREERSAPVSSDIDIELREVRYGTKTHGPYLRVVPGKQRLTRLKPGYLEATELGSQPADSLGRFFASLRRIFIGGPLATSQAIHERLTKVKALAVLSSDALSSSAYATEEILIVLLVAGSGSLNRALPISMVILLLLGIVTLSYRQTIRAYPSGGGAYIVAHENLGIIPGLTAAGALMVDYVLTVSVSVAAGVAAITSAVPDLEGARVIIAVIIVALITTANLRGIRDSGTIFAAPTYFFLALMGAMIVTGFVKVLIGDAPGSLTAAAPPTEQVAATQGLSLWLILRAFSSGSTALTGVEAISDGVPAFKPPESQNARTTLTVMAGILAFLFLGVTFLSSRYGLVPHEDETIVSVLGRDVFGENVLYYAYQVATALVLFLAANTSFADFPRLSSILARDRLMPRQFGFRGDRLAFSNGIMLLAVAASVLLLIYGAEVSRLIPLYAVGVFVSFTLSQSGMVRRWWRLKEHGWKLGLAINGVGAAACGVVAVIIGSTKFAGGAWISILLIIAVMVLFNLIRRHYHAFEEATRIRPEDTGAPAWPQPTPDQAAEHIVVPVNTLDKLILATMKHALEASSHVTAVHLAEDQEQAEAFRKQWEQALPGVPLLIIESPYRVFVTPMMAYLESLEATSPDIPLTLLLPTVSIRHWWERPLHNQTVKRLIPLVRRRTRIQVAEYRYEPQMS